MSYLDWQKIHEDMVQELMTNMPESWDGDESAEALVIEYVHQLEIRLDELGGSLERYPEPDEEKETKNAQEV